MRCCFQPLTGPLIIAALAIFAAAFVLLGVVMRRSGEAQATNRTFVGSAGVILGIAALVGALILWLGSYAYSPLEFAHGPALTGFEIQKQGGQSLIVPPDGGFSMSTHAYAYIKVIADPPIADCSWHSAAGAAMDPNNTCDIVYAPPPAEQDVLRVSARLACGLPTATGQIKIAILP